VLNFDLMRAKAKGVLAFLAAAACLLGSPAPVAAQTGGRQVGEAARELARDLFRRGRELYQRGKAEEALDLLRQSYDLLPSWATLNGMALCEDSLTHYTEALQLYERSLAEGGTAISAEQKAQLEQRILELRRSLDLAVLSISSSPSGAQVSIDGTALGPTPGQAEVSGGTHTLVLTLDGYETAERTVTVNAGETGMVDVSLAVAVEAPEAPPGGRLAVTADEPGWTVFVDGTQVGTTPLQPTDVEAGERTVRVEGPNGAWEDRVQVPEGQLVRVGVRMGGGGVAQGWFWGVAATAAAAGIGWAAAGGYAWSLYDEYQGASPQRRDEIRPTQGTLLDVADALLGVAAGAAVTALVLGFFTNFGGDAEADVAVEGAGQGASDATATTGPASW
jgi:hypothetical protein